MFWADEIAAAIKQRASGKPQHVDDMKTPSGKIHVGSLRGVLIHDLVHKALLQLGIKSEYTYVFNDMDPMDGLPSYLDAAVYEPFMGYPLFKIPAPDGKSESLARQYAQEFIDTIKILGATPEIVWSHELYESGGMNDLIREVLDEASEIRSIYRDVAGYDRADNWYPFQVICPKCGRVGTTVVDEWDGSQVHFICQPDLVKWARGCGNEGKISPFNGNGKLMWKVDWPAHWKKLGITVEGAGKDHSSAGGSRDMAKAMCERVFNYPHPYDIPYEWFLIGGKKMSSSKGVGTSAQEFSEILPPSVARFLFTRSRFSKQMNFDPSGMTIPDLFDEYDRCANLFWKEGKENDQARAWEMAQIGDVPEEHFLPRFIDVAQYIQMPNIILNDKFTEIKGMPLTDLEMQELEIRSTYARQWLDRYAPVDLKFMPAETEKTEVKLTDKQVDYLHRLAELLGDKEWEPETLQNELYGLGKSMDLSSGEIFKAIYGRLIGKDHGPKAAWLILDLDRIFVLEQFRK